MDEEQGGTKPGDRLSQPTAGIALRVERAGGLVALGSLDTVPEERDLEAWSRALSDWSRNPEIYGSIVDTGDWSSQQAKQQAVEQAVAPGTLRALYSLIWRLNCFTKPAVGLMGGATPAWALALAHAGTHRVAGPGFRFQVPPADGAAPLYGLAHALAGMPFALGTYLALTGAPVGRADAYALGLITHCVDAAAFPAIAAGIAGADPVDPLLDDRHVNPEAGGVMRDKAWIERCFSAGSIAVILDRLGRETGAESVLALSTRDALAGRPEPALTARLALIRRAQSLDLRAALIDDFTCNTPPGTPPLELVSRAALQAPPT